MTKHYVLPRFLAGPKTLKIFNFHLVENIRQLNRAATIQIYCEFASIQKIFELSSIQNDTVTKMLTVLTLMIILNNQRAFNLIHRERSMATTK